MSLEIFRFLRRTKSFISVVLISAIVHKQHTKSTLATYRRHVTYPTV